MAIREILVAYAPAGGCARVLPVEPAAVQALQVLAPVQGLERAEWAPQVLPEQQVPRELVQGRWLRRQLLLCLQLQQLEPFR